MMPRYHYVPTLFLTVFLALAAETAAARGHRARRVTHGLMVAVLLWLPLRAWLDRSTVLGLVRPDGLEGPSHQLEAEVERSPEDAVAFLPNTPVGFFGLHSDTFPGQAALCVILHPGGVVGGRAVRFVESDPHLRAVLKSQTDTPISRLIVGPDDVPRNAS
jgi:hypothetical protein